MDFDQVVNDKLKPKSARRVNPRVCATCILCISVTDEGGDPVGVMMCQRPNGPSFDVGDGYQWFTVCDGYKPEAS